MKQIVPQQSGKMFRNYYGLTETLVAAVTLTKKQIAV